MRRRWTWLWAMVVALGVVLVVLAVVALLATERQQMRPVDPSISETPAGIGPTG